MALQGPIPVEFAHVFPHGAFAAGGFEPMRDFDASSGDRFVQAKDKATGQPVWVVEVIDGLTVTPYVNQAGRLAYSLKAAGVRGPGRSGRAAPDGRETAA